MNENRISENDMFKNETIEKLIDTKDIIKSHLASLDAKHMIKSLLAFLVVYKEVFTETNKPIKNYIEMVRQKSKSTQSGGSVNEENISLISNDLYSEWNRLKNNSTSILDDINYLPVLKQIAVAFVDVIKKLISTSLDIAKNMSQNVSDNIGKTSKNVFSRTAVKYAIIVIITILILSEEQIKNTPTNQIAAVVKQKVKSYSEYLNMLTNDPNHVEAIRELSLVVASALNKAIDLIEPQVSEIIQKLEKLLENASHDIARGVTHTGLGLAKAFIAEAPIVGGLVDFVITGAEAFTSSSKIAKSLVNDGGAIVDNIIQILSQFRQLSDQKKGEFSEALNNFNKLPRNSSIPSNANLVQPNNPQARSRNRRRPNSHTAFRLPNS